MKSLGYILPTNLSHEGILIKVQGQMNALENLFDPKLCFINYTNSDFFLKKLLSYILFEISALYFILRYQIIYVRYNPKSILLNIAISVFSWIKPIYVEHNTLYSPELAFLNRKKELLLHKLIYFLYRFSNIYHIGVNQELCDHLIDSKLRHVIYSQNGYTPPALALQERDIEILNQVKAFKDTFKTCAIFCGNGYEWHGVKDVIDSLNSFPDIGLIVVGPFDIKSEKNILSLSFVESACLASIIELCHFAISTFRWDLIHISHGSPLKSRQYLCHGCPIVVNYYDCAMDYTQLHPYIIDFRSHAQDSFKQAATLNYDKSNLKSLAQKLLSWDVYFKTIFS